MKRSMVWTVGSFLGGLILERILAAALASSAGGQFLARVDRRNLTPFEHRTLARLWAGRLAKAFMALGPVLGIVIVPRLAARQRDAASPSERKPTDWVGVTSRAAELLLALGAILKVISEYLEEREAVEAAHVR